MRPLREVSYYLKIRLKSTINLVVEKQYVKGHIHPALFETQRA